MDIKSSLGSLLILSYRTKVLLTQGPCHREGGGGAMAPHLFYKASSFKTAVKGVKALDPTFASLCLPL